MTDPVCGMAVREDIPHRTEWRGATYRFCSDGCRRAFETAPERYGEASIPAPPPPPQLAGNHTCPMHPDVRRPVAGTCPKCGMALELVAAAPRPQGVEYTCPMQPEVVRDAPGACPICGMALEPRELTGAEINPELVDMSRRFWIATALTLPILAFMASDLLPGQGLHAWLGSGLSALVEFALATPVVIWAGWPLFARGAASVAHRSPNMFTLTP